MNNIQKHTLSYVDDKLDELGDVRVLPREDDQHTVG